MQYDGTAGESGFDTTIGLRIATKTIRITGLDRPVPQKTTAVEQSVRDCENQSNDCFVDRFKAPNNQLLTVATFEGL